MIDQRRRWWAWISGAGAIVLGLGWGWRGNFVPESIGSSPSQTITEVNSRPISDFYPPMEGAVDRLQNFKDDPLVGGLLDPTGSATRDLAIVAEVLEAWQTNFPHQGNPVGENVEITAALMGRNALKLALIPANHPAVNRRGELCDRWNSPLFFHQLSGTQMELRSAGPDRKFYTADDLLWSP